MRTKGKISTVCASHCDSGLGLGWSRVKRMQSCPHGNDGQVGEIDRKQVDKDVKLELVASAVQETDRVLRDNDAKGYYYTLQCWHQVRLVWEDDLSET